MAAGLRMASGCSAQAEEAATGNGGRTAQSQLLSPSPFPPQLEVSREASREACLDASLSAQGIEDVRTAMPRVGGGGLRMRSGSTGSLLTTSTAGASTGCGLAR